MDEKRVELYRIRSYETGEYWKNKVYLSRAAVKAVYTRNGLNKTEWDVEIYTYKEAVSGWDI